jgi:hypothetical protein
MPHRPWRQGVCIFVAGFVAVTGLFEVVVASLFSMPPDARQPEGGLVRYFSYGLSTEAKLDRTVGSADQEPTDIVKAGWIAAELKSPDDDWWSASLRYVFYGMSFTNKIAKDVADLDHGSACIARAGPAAPLSHSYAMFESDPVRANAHVVVVGVLSSSLPHLQSMTGLGWTPESPAPFTFPMFRWQNDELNRLDPVIQDRETFVRAFREDSPLWQRHLAAVRQHDAYWDSIVFRRSALDHSALARLVRRAWASRKIRTVSDSIYHSDGAYDTSHPAIAAVPHLLQRMHESCRQHGQQLIVVLLHALGEPGRLDAWLADDLRDMGVKVVSSVDYFASTDGQNFVDDGHYTAANTAALARAVIAAIGREDL